jgi:TRAP-type C4-dicarboxylate transport system permease small subunit
MQKVRKTFQWLIGGLSHGGMVCLIGMTSLTCADVIGRFFGYPIFGSVELVGFMATIAVAAALPYTHQTGGHVGVEILFRLFSMRTQRIIKLCTSVLTFILIGLITWRMLVYAQTIQKSGEVSMSLEFPEYLIIYAVSFCFLVLFFVIVHDIIQDMMSLRGNE